MAFTVAYEAGDGGGLPPPWLENFRANSVFRASTSCSKDLKDKKYFNTGKSFRATLFFRARQFFKNLNNKKSVTGRQGRQGREFLPYHNHEMCKTI